MVAPRPCERGQGVGSLSWDRRPTAATSKPVEIARRGDPPRTHCNLAYNMQFGGGWRQLATAVAPVARREIDGRDAGRRIPNFQSDRLHEGWQASGLPAGPGR